jgi:hypothetical protein
MIKYTPEGEVNGEYANYPYPVLANTITIQGVTIEKQPPQVVNTGDAPVTGGPSNTPQLATGDIRNTTISVSNKRREHVCDFVLEMRKNVQLKKFLRAIAKPIRDAIRWVMKSLGLSDRSGKFTELVNELKAYARELRRIQKEIIQPIIDFEKYILAYITKLRAIIQWILSLPARLLALLRDCLERLLKLIGNIFTDFLKELSPGDGGGGFTELLEASKELATEAGNTVKKATEAVALAAAIPVAATVGLLVPVSQSELDAANTFISTYETENPNVAQITGASTSMSKLREFGFPDSDTLNTTAEEMKPSTP